MNLKEFNRTYDRRFETDSSLPTSVQSTIVAELSRRTAKAIDTSVDMAFERKTGRPMNYAEDMGRFSQVQGYMATTFFLDGEPLVLITIRIGDEKLDVLDESCGQFLFGPSVVATYLGNDEAGQPTV